MDLVIYHLIHNFSDNYFTPSKLLIWRYFKLQNSIQIAAFQNPAPAKENLHAIRIEFDKSYHIVTRRSFALWLIRTLLCAFFFLFFSTSKQNNAQTSENVTVALLLFEMSIGLAPDLNWIQTILNGIFRLMRHRFEFYWKRVGLEIYYAFDWFFWQ